MDPILHLSLPVHDLAEARRFYLEALGCRPGRERPDWCDVWFYGMQVTLQERPDQVLADEQRGVRHFGVTLTGDELDRLLQRLRGHQVQWLAPETIDYTGTRQEQRKAKVLDPSGNAIEIKTYTDPEAALAVIDLPPV